VRRHHPSTILVGVADLDHTVAEGWGVWGEKSKEGRDVRGHHPIVPRGRGRADPRGLAPKRRPNGWFPPPWRRSRRR